jgi:Baseplate J-like protein
MAIVPVALSDLITPVPPSQVLATELSIAAGFGLPTTAWQPLSVIPVVLETNATIAADTQSTIGLIAMGGYASLAATMVDGAGNPITTWMQLRATDQYNVTPQGATYASGPVTLFNGGPTTPTYSPSSPLHFQRTDTGATYTSTGSGTIGLGYSTVNVQADLPGSSSNAGTSIVLALITPLVGVSVNGLTQALVGFDSETNQQLLSRCQNKLATLCPIQSTDQPGPVSGGAMGAYDYVARTIPQAAVASAVPPYAVTSPITKTAVGSVAGQPTLYLANASGIPSDGDVAVVNAAIQQLVVPSGVTAYVSAATTYVIPITAQVFVQKSAGLQTSAVTANISTALANYFAAAPIGGYSTTAPNIIPISDIIKAIFDANPGTIDVVMNTPTGSVSIGPSSVAEEGEVSITVVQV